MKFSSNTLLISFAALTLLSGCTLYQEGTLTENRVKVTEKKFVEEVPLRQFDDNYIAGLSHHYLKHGGGPMTLTVAYDPHSHTNTAMNASQEMARMVRGLNNNGVDDVRADILPVQGRGDEGLVVVSYMAYDASAPDGCTTMPGFENTVVDHDEEYKIGCTLETLYARQVSRPRDLMGRGMEGQTSDGRRAANMGELYRGGLGNKKLDGESASE